MAGRVSQEAIEVALDAGANARVSQEVIGTVIDARPNARISQMPMEAIIDGHGNVRISQDTIEAILDAHPGVHISQIVLEIVANFIEIPMPLVYPALPGLAFPVGWATDFFNAPTVTTSTGAEIDIAISDTPLHTFSLQYEFLRDTPFGLQEQRTLRGFFGANRGNRVRFCFKLDEDHNVSNQLIGTTDGSTRVWTLQRTYGVGENSWTESIGYVDLTLPFRVYLDNVLQDPSSYTVDTTLGAQQQIIFGGVPAAGKVITVDMEYFYYCKFKDPEMNLDKFITNIWSGEKIELRSCRPGA